MRFAVRCFRFVWDCIANLLNIHTLWGFIKHTWAGKVIAGIAAGLGVAWWGLAHDPVLSTILFALFASALVMVVLHLISDARKSPRLRFQQIVTVKEIIGNEEGGWFVRGVGRVRPLAIQIKNTQVAVDVSANGVSGTAKFMHQGESVESPIRWINDGERGCDFIPEVHIRSGATATCAFLFEKTGTDQKTQWCVATDFESEPTYKPLKAGEWKVAISLKSSNSGPVKLIGRFTILRDNRIELNPGGASCIRQQAVWN